MIYQPQMGLGRMPMQPMGQFQGMPQQGMPQIHPALLAHLQQMQQMQGGLGGMGYQQPQMGLGQYGVRPLSPVSAYSLR